MNLVLLRKGANSPPLTRLKRSAWNYITLRNLNSAIPIEISALSPPISKIVRSVYVRTIAPVFSSVDSCVIFSFKYLIWVSFICRRSLGKPNQCLLVVYVRNDILFCCFVDCESRRPANPSAWQNQKKRKLTKLRFLLPREFSCVSISPCEIAQLKSSRKVSTLVKFILASGVVSDFGHPKGTGGGTRAQEKPNITFPDQTA